MGTARGIAGSRAPEQEGCFVCTDELEVEWFITLNNTDDPVDVCAIDGMDEADLIESSEGYMYLPTRIPAERLTLVRRDCTA
jgi:hypothetical protein